MNNHYETEAEMLDAVIASARADMLEMEVSGYMEPEELAALGVRIAQLEDERAGLLGG